MNVGENARIVGKKHGKQGLATAEMMIGNISRRRLRRCLRVYIICDFLRHLWQKLRPQIAQIAQIFSLKFIRDFLRHLWQNLSSQIAQIAQIFMLKIHLRFSATSVAKFLAAVLRHFMISLREVDN